MSTNPTVIKYGTGWYLLREIEGETKVLTESM